MEIYFTVGVLGAIITAVQASQKNRNVVGWAVAGFLFPLIAILVLAASPTLMATYIPQPLPPQFGPPPNQPPHTTQTGY